MDTKEDEVGGDDEDDEDNDNDQLENKTSKFDEEKVGPLFQLNHTDLKEYIKKKKLTGEDIENTQIRTIYQI